MFKTKSTMLVAGLNHLKSFYLLDGLIPVSNPQQCDLVGGIPTPLKNISHLGLLFPIIIWKHKNIFQTTNQ
jgi:hypothetical protein